jgi:hypothetical protein
MVIKPRVNTYGKRKVKVKLDIKNQTLEIEGPLEFATKYLDRFPLKINEGGIKKEDACQ